MAELSPELESKIMDLEKAYTGRGVRSALSSFFNYVANYGFAASFLGGIPAGDFLTRERLYDIFRGRDVQVYDDKPSLTSKRSLMASGYELYFGNPAELYDNYNKISKIITASK